MNIPFDDPGHSANDFFISTDKTLLNVPFITTQLKQTYWGGWLTLPAVIKAIDHSLCFGLYQRVDGLLKQVGFARVVTDYSTFAWICDVFIASPHRKRGLGKFIMQTVMKHPDLDRIACLLVTNDAQKFYERFGFTILDETKCMKRPGTR